jgi:hypothetical protein
MVIPVSVLIHIAFFLLNIVIAIYQAYRFDVQQKRINHTVWAIGYGALVAITWPIHHNTYLIAVITTLHLPLFNTALNFFRTPRRPLFYTHPEDPKGSWIDKLWMDAYPAVFCGSVIFYIVLNFYLYGKA